MTSPSKKPEAVRKWREERKRLGLCVSCKENAVPERTMCEKHLVAAREKSARLYRKGGGQWHRAAYREHRARALAAYGGRCSCCGEAEEKFLTFDHVWGEGSAHRRVVGGGIGFLKWLEAENYPDSIRVLCGNCHGAITRYGSCPHQGD